MKEKAVVSVIERDAVLDLLRKLTDEVNFGIHSFLSFKGSAPSRWLSGSRRKILERRRRREGLSRVSFPLMRELADAFQMRQLPAEERRISLLGYLAQIELFLEAHDVYSEMPQVLGRMIFDIRNGKVDPVFEAGRGGRNYTLELYELQKRAVSASKFIKIAENCTQAQADEWVWERIQPLPTEFQVEESKSSVIGNWRRSLRRLARGNSLQSWWADTDIDLGLEFPLPIPPALWREVEWLHRDLGYGAKQIALRLLLPFEEYRRKTSTGE